jgi:energy-coupling factor transport system ATP-binding protein
VLEGLTTSISEGELHAFIGGNGTGKSTLLKIFAGLAKVQKGKVNVAQGKRLTMLFQDTKAMFYCDTVAEDLIDGGHASESEIGELADRLNIASILNRNPFDLSGGEIQKAAFMKALLVHPDILLLDEPVKGLDAESCEIVGEILEERKKDGCTIVMVTHDIVFAAKHADRCSMLFGKAIIANGEGREFFNENVFYTTPINRMTRGIADGCVNIGDLQIARKE